MSRRGRRLKPADQNRVVEEVIHRSLLAQDQDPRGIDQILFETIFHERQRLEKEKNRDKAKKELRFYRKIQSEALRANPELQRDLLAKVIRNFTKEILGNFDIRMYQMATRAVPVVLNFALHALSPLKILRELPNGLSNIDDQVIISGETKALQKVTQLGTTIVLPTHVSNLDSILVGYMLHNLGLPPYIYGAGLNLFSNKVLGFFMDSLGAYKVDRKKKAKLYKDVLKIYAGYSMELGYHNLFFPGGTRSRSGKVEQKLKLGLIGMGLNAYIHNIRSGKKHPDIFVIPCTINYQLVLEAETLIEDHLKEVGKSRYIIEDDESYQIKKILDFLNKLFSLDSRIHIRISKPLDVFGNFVDSKGQSRDHCNRVIDRKRYVMVDGEPEFDSQRDMEYTNELANSICEAYSRDTVIASVNLISKVVLDWLKENNPGLDLYRLLRTGGNLPSMPLIEIYKRIDRTLASLKKLAKAGKIHLDETLQGRDTVAMLSEALAHFKDYHVHQALERRGDRLYHMDRELLLYYQNRIPAMVEAS